MIWSETEFLILHFLIFILTFSAPFSGDDLTDLDDEEDTENEETEIEIDHLSPPQLLSLSKSESKKVEKTVSEKITKKDVDEVVNEVEEVGDEELLGKNNY